MKVKLSVDLHNGTPPVELVTNMYVVCEWEKLENRKVSDGKGIGYTDLACWAYHLCKLAGDTVPDNWREWVKQHPDMDLTSVDETNPNPTALALTEDN